MNENIEGGCLCGSVRYAMSSAAAFTGHCYCEDCRRSSGTDHCTHSAFPETAMTLTGQVQFYDRPADSGNVISRGFCPHCGSAILSRNSGMTGMVFIRASSLDNPDTVQPAMTVYASRAPGWARIARENPVFELMPPQMPEEVRSGQES